MQKFDRIYKSISLPLWMEDIIAEMAKKGHRSFTKQVEFLVELQLEKKGYKQKVSTSARLDEPPRGAA